MKQHTINLITVGLLSLGAASCSDNGTVQIAGNPDSSELSSAQLDSRSGNIVETAVSVGAFNTLAAALQATGLDAVLSDESRQFTVFAPTDEAFAKLGQDTINALLNDTDTLKDILLYHVIADAKVDAATAVSLDGEQVEAANGDKFAVTVDNGKLFINMSQVINTDVAANNGVIHVIDTVLTLPPDMPSNDEPTPDIVQTAVAAGSFSTLVAALQATGLDATLSGEGPFTVFAPTDAAFEKLGADTINALLADPESLSDILLYHVIAGQAVEAQTAISLSGTSVTVANGDTVALALRDGSLFINESVVEVTDIVTSNGIIHVIDTVLTPPVSAPETPDATLLQIAEQAGFTTLVAALEATGLDGAIGHPGDNYTVFAPTDAAFAALGTDTINALLADPDTLRNILLFHVLPGNVIDSTDAQSLIGFDIQTGNGDNVKFERDNEGLSINGARIVSADITGVNGVIHVIDSVLIPPAQ